MESTLTGFSKTKEFLICVDSDGCAMDTMDIKHIKCFGPCLVEEWSLQEWSEDILERWNDMNLYTMTRGINRFKGLSMMLSEINDSKCKIAGVEELARWIKESDELSNEALQREIQKTENPIFVKALSWSRKVNQKINELAQEEKLPFAGVKEALKKAHKWADVAIVSSANLQAVLEEWEYYELTNHVDVVLAQDSGSKKYCIEKLIEKGYKKENVIMVGDAKGDYEAAQGNEVYYYPILVRHEKESWQEFQNVALSHFLEGTYKGEYQQKKADAFFKNLQK